MKDCMNDLYSDEVFKRKIKDADDAVDIDQLCIKRLVAVAEDYGPHTKVLKQLLSVVDNLIETNAT